MPEALPAFERKTSSRASTGRTNRSSESDQSVSKNRVVQSAHVVDVDAEGERATTEVASEVESEQEKCARSVAGPALPLPSRPPQPPREGTGQMRDRVAQDLKEDYDRHIIVDKLFEKIYRATSSTRDVTYLFLMRIIL